MSILFVTGTDTGAGKTVVSATIAAGLAAQGRRVGVAKPLETGCAGDEATDAATLRGAIESSEPLDVVSPHRLPEPLAPSIAADRAGVTLDPDAIAAALRARAEGFDVLLVEGAGGLLVPVTAHVSFADLAKTLDARVLTVVGSRLGAINHALLTFEVLAARGLRSCGYVLSQLAPTGDLATDTNAELLASLTSERCLGMLPWLADAALLLGAVRTDEGQKARERLATLAATHLDLDAIAGS